MRYRQAFLLALFSVSSLLASEEAHGAAAEHGDPLLTSKWINFAILAGGLGYLFVKFAFPVFREQQREILASMDQASRQAEEAAARARAIDERMANLQQEVEALRQKALAEMKNEARRAEEETAAALAKVEHAAEVEIASAVKAAKQELAASAAHLALALARRKVAERLTPQAQTALVSRFTDRLETRA